MEGGYITGSHPYHTMDTGTKRAKVAGTGLVVAGTTALAGMVPQVRDYVVETVKSEARKFAKRKISDLREIARGVVRYTRDLIEEHNNNFPGNTIYLRGKRFNFESLGNKFPLFT